MTDASNALIAPTWVGSLAGFLTLIVLTITLRVALLNLRAFKDADRIARTSQLFFDFFSKEFVGEANTVGGVPVKKTPYAATTALVTAPTIVKSEILFIVHNYFEAVASLHWKTLIDSDLYFDSFAQLIMDVYEPLTTRLIAEGNPLTKYSRIPQLFADAEAYLRKRAAQSK